MNNLITFLNSFMSYLLLVLVIVGAGAVAFILGRILKKRKDASLAQKAEEEENRVVE